MRCSGLGVANLDCSKPVSVLRHVSLFPRAGV